MASEGKNLGGWLLYPVEWPGASRTEYHVVPQDDLKEHDFAACWCKPVVDDEEPNCIVHNSMDRREDFEEGRSLIS